MVFISSASLYSTPPSSSSSSSHAKVTIAEASPALVSPFVVVVVEFDAVVGVVVPRLALSFSHMMSMGWEALSSHDRKSWS